MNTGDASADAMAGRWVSDNDALILEDESGRIALVPAASSSFAASAFCTGAVLSVLGRQEDGGRFVVERAFAPDLAPQPPLAAAQPAQPSAAPRYVLLVSGLSVGCPSAHPLPLQLLHDYVAGFEGQGEVSAGNVHDRPALEKHTAGGVTDPRAALCCAVIVRCA